MPLTCYCDDSDFDWYYSPSEDFEPLARKRRQRCASCKKLIDIGADALAFTCWRSYKTDIEERIYGEEVPLADRYHCEECGGLFMALAERGYCIDPTENMRSLAREHGEIEAEAARSALAQKERKP